MPFKALSPIGTNKTSQPWEEVHVWKTVSNQSPENKDSVGSFMRADCSDAVVSVEDH